MDIRILRYFLTVAKSENITKAANALHIAQPSLSKQLMELEDELGTQLLIRGKRKVSLTEDGIFLSKRAEEIISLLEKTEREITSEQENIYGDISIGSGETEAMDVVLQAASALSRKYPEIHYHLFSGDATDVMERLDQGILDFGILIEPIDTLKYDSIHLPVTDIWGILMTEDSTLAQKEFLHPEDLVDLPLIIPQRSGLQRDFSLWIGKDIQKLNVVATYNLGFNASMPVKQRLGYALALDKLIYTGPGSGLTFRPLAPEMKAQLSLVWKRYQFFSKASEQFLKAVQTLI